MLRHEAHKADRDSDTAIQIVFVKVAHDYEAIAKLMGKKAITGAGETFSSDSENAAGQGC